MIDAPLGSRENPLRVYDLPFTVPKDGVYWLAVNNDTLIELPPAPEGAVLDVERMLQVPGEIV